MPTPAVVNRVTARGMSARIITLKRSTKTIEIYDKSGNTLSGPTTYNSFFSGLTGTPCTNANDGDPYVIYDRVR